MVLYPPKSFDANEWFLLIAGAIILIVVLVLPRPLSAIEIVMIWGFNHLLAKTADFTLAVPPIDLYDFNDWPQFEYIDFYLQIYLYPITAYLFLYLYDRWKLTKGKLVLYIAVWALLSAGLEYISSLFGVFAYKGWKLWYSILVYIVVYVMNVYLLRFIRKYTGEPV